MKVPSATTVFATLALLATSAACAAQTSRIVFERSLSNSDGTLRSSTLYRVNADGTGLVRLRPMTTGVYLGAATWSPHGTAIAYQRSAGAALHSDIWIMTAAGNNPRRITSGATDHLHPAWGPDGGRVAFIARGASGACLGLVRPDGTGQHELFCPPGPASIDRTPQWTPDGNALLVSTSFAGAGIDAPLHVRAWRVDAATGSTVLLAAREEDASHPRSFVFSADGRRALFASDWSEQPIEYLDFAAGTSTLLGQGRAAVFSHDGSRFAFTRRGFTGAPDFLSFDHVWVADVDGGAMHEVTPALVDDIEYVAAGWSGNDTRLLVDRTVYAPIAPGSGLYVGTPAMRIFNVATGAQANLPGGAAEDWYQSP